MAPSGRAALFYVEDLFLIDLADARLILGGVLITAEGNRGIGVGSAVRVNQECITFRVIFTALEMPGDMNQSPKRGAAFTH